MKAFGKTFGSFFIVLCCTLSMLCFVPPQKAEAGDAMGNIFMPDTTAFMLYARQKTGDRVYKDGKLVGKNGDYDLTYQIVRPAYYTTLKGIPVTVQALLPFGHVSVRNPGAASSSSVSGLMDPTLLLGLWPISDPDNKFWVNFLEWITMPFGQYDNTGLSLGANRWGFKTSMGIVKGWGNFYVDVEPSIEFYTKNDEFGADEYDQDMDPMFRLEGHLSYNFTPQFRLAAGYYYENGGERSYRDVGGFKIKSDEKDNHTADLTAFIQLAPQHQILVQYTRDLEVENGFKYSQVGLRYFYKF